MDLLSVDRLLRLAQSAKNGEWPLPAEKPILEAINTWVALREADKDTLRRVTGWPTHRAYRVDPLPERISDAWAHYLFGSDPQVTATADSDTRLYEELLERDFPSELERAAGLAVSEGEAWARVYVDENVAPRPLLEWHSRANVLPVWVGSTLKAAALITELPDPDGRRNSLFRHFEIHVAGGVVNVLFAGRDDRLGDIVDLDRHPATSELDESWEHGLPGMLMERVPNRLRRDRRIGVSDYQGILDYLLDLNEAAAIGAHNVRLTARKRAVVTSAALERPAAGDNTTLGDTAPRPVFDPGEEIFVEDPLDVEMGRGGTSPLRVLEYSFDAEALIAWKRDLVESALTRVGLAVQYAGVNAAAEGYAISGTALRLRLIPTDATGRGKGRYWDDALPRILATMAAVDALSLAAGGFGRPWARPLDPPVIVRRPGIPVDELEEAQKHQALLGARAESTYTAVRALHPDWTEQDVTAEVDRIQSAQSATLPLGF